MATDDRRSGSLFGPRDGHGRADHADNDDAARADELRYDGPITIEEDDDDAPSHPPRGRSFITAALIFGAVVVVIAAAFLMQGGVESGSDDPWETPAGTVAAEPEANVPATEPPPPAVAETDSRPSFDYRALPETPAPTVEPEPEPAPARASARTMDRPLPREAGETFAESRGSEPAPTYASGTLDAMQEDARSGRVDAAALAGAALYRDGSTGPWTLQVLMACEPATVAKAFSNVVDPSLYVTPMRYQSRSCYRLSWGSFASRDEALSARDRVPAYFAEAGKALPVSADSILSR